MTKKATMDVKHCQADEYLRGLKDNFIDLTIVDPPYLYNGLKSVKHSKIDKHGIKSKPQLSKAFKAINESALGGGFDFDFNLLNLIEQKMKLLNMYIFCNLSLLQRLLFFYDGRKDVILDLLVWHKTNPPPFCNNSYLKHLEYILFIRQSGATFNSKFETSKKIFTTSVPSGAEKHPTIKPVQIIERFIQNSSNKGDNVLDCFLGSGTTAVAAIESNRNFYGCEINKEYHADAIMNIKNYQKRFIF